MLAKKNGNEEERRKAFMDEQLPQIARMFVLYWSPTPVIPSDFMWSIIEDLYCMMDCKPMPKSYPQVKRKASAWKSRRKTIRDNLKPEHIDQIQDALLEGKDLSQLRFVYAQNKIFSMKAESPASGPPSMQNKHTQENPSNSNQKEAMDTHRNQVVGKIGKNTRIQEASQQDHSRQFLVFTLLKIAALYDYSPKEYFSLYDMALMLAHDEKLKYQWLSKTYQLPNTQLKGNLDQVQKVAIEDLIMRIMSVSELDPNEFTVNVSNGQVYLTKASQSAEKHLSLKAPQSQIQSI